MPMSGKDGSVSVGGNRVAELSNWSLDLGADDIDVTTFDSAGWKEFLQGLKEWSGSAEGNFNLSDTNGQRAIYNAWVSGTPLDVTFQTAAAGTAFQGQVLPKLNIETPVDDKASVSFDFKGTGPLQLVE